jgi:hypothetical protein
MPQSFGFFVIFGSLFGLLAAACAFVIAYAEYQHHFPDKGRPIRMALHIAFITFLFFFFASFLLPWLLESFGAGK